MTKSPTEQILGNGADVSGGLLIPPPSLNPERQEKLREKTSLAAKLLLPNPDELNAVAAQLVIPIIKKAGPLEYFRAHPTMRLTMLMTTVDTAQIEPPVYGVMPDAVPSLRREKIEPVICTLYPLVFDTKPLTYKLLQVKPPATGRKWDSYNLGRKLAADAAVDGWIAMRAIAGGYEAYHPDPEAKFPEAVWPEWTEDDWIEKSLGVTGQLVFDDSHDIFKDLRHLR